MNNSLMVMHWNINQKNKDSNTPEMVASEILKETSERKRSDIIVLTEFLKTRNYENVLVKPLEDNGYTVFLDPRNAKKNIRQVLIAIQKDVMDTAQPVDTTPIYLPDNEYEVAQEEFYDAKIEHFPNYLCVRCMIGGVPLSIIGTRIRVWNANREKERLFRKWQFEKLMEKIPKNEHIIVLGDFNISPVQEGEIGQFLGENWHFDNTYKVGIEKNNLTLSYPIDSTLTSPINSKYKLDHLIVGGGISVDEKSVKYYVNPTWISGINYPDHAILTAIVSINGTENEDCFPCPICGELKSINGFSIPDMCDDCRQGEE